MSTSISSQPVSTIMTKDVLAVTRDESLYECRHLFSKHDFHHIPVVDGDRLVGIISVSDLVAAGVLAAFPEDDTEVRSSFEAAAMSVTDAMRPEPVVVPPRHDRSRRFDAGAGDLSCLAGGGRGKTRRHADDVGPAAATRRGLELLADCGVG